MIWILLGLIALILVAMAVFSLTHPVELPDCCKQGGCIDQEVR